MIQAIYLKAKKMYTLDNINKKKILYNGILSLWNQHKGYKVYLFAYHLGKEEVFIKLAKHFNTKIVLTNERYESAKLIGLDMELFTTKHRNGWIFVRNFNDRKKMNIEEMNNYHPTIFIILTGKSEFVWENKTNIFNARYNSLRNLFNFKYLTKYIQSFKSLSLDFYINNLQLNQIIIN